MAPPPLSTWTTRVYSRLPPPLPFLGPSYGASPLQALAPLVSRASSLAQPPLRRCAAAALLTKLRRFVAVSRALRQMAVAPATSPWSAMGQPGAGGAAPTTSGGPSGGPPRATPWGVAKADEGTGETEGYYDPAWALLASDLEAHYEQLARVPS